MINRTARVIDLLKLFYDKTVLVLGSAPNVLKMPANKMENFDIIVRVNNYTIFNECKRVDVYYSFFGKSIRKNIASLNDGGCKLLMGKCPNEPVEVIEDGKLNDNLSDDFRWIYEYREPWFNDSGIPLYITTLKHFNENNKKVGQICTTGVAAILDILRFQPKLLYFTGFDFATSGIHNVNQKMIFKPYPKIHHFKSEFYLMKELLKTNKKLECSNEVKDVLSNDYKGCVSWIK